MGVDSFLSNVLLEFFYSTHRDISHSACKHLLVKFIQYIRETCFVQTILLLAICNLTHAPHCLGTSKVQYNLNSQKRKQTTAINIELFEDTLKQLEKFSLNFSVKLQSISILAICRQGQLSTSTVSVH